MLCRMRDLAISVKWDLAGFGIWQFSQAGFRIWLSSWSKIWPFFKTGNGISTHHIRCKNKAIGIKG